MTAIRTVRGDIPPEMLGITYAHEHLIGQPPAHASEPDFVLDSEPAAVSELGYFRAAGGSALVEMSPRDYGRSPEALRRLSDHTGIHIICATGWHKEKFSGALVTGRGVQDLADEMIADIEAGIGGGAIQAGVIKAASSLNTISASEEKVFRAAAIAHRATGAPISTHTEAGTMALEQVALLRGEGVAPERIIIGHVDRHMDYDSQRALLATGVTIIYDQVGKEKYAPDRQRIDFLSRLVAEGYGGRIMLSGDMARRSSWPSYGTGGGPGLTYILWRFAPWLRESGLAEPAIQDMLVNTPARLFQLHKTP
jgi:predicted metal-dependent phosphotriesterase family hydrolase